MREARTLGSWVIALFLRGDAALGGRRDARAASRQRRTISSRCSAEASGIAYFEPTGRFAFGVLEVLAALLIFVPVTRRFGAILGLLAAGRCWRRWSGS